MVSGRVDPAPQARWAIPSWYRRWASLRGWYWGAAKVVLYLGLSFALAAVGFLIGAYLVFALGLVDLYIWRAVREERPLGTVGLAKQGWRSQTLGGFVFGAVLMSVIVGVMAVAGWYGVERFAIGRLADVLTAGLLFYLLVAVMEEVIFRGMVFRFLERRVGSWITLVITSVLFGLGHVGNPNATVVSALAIGVEAGILLGAAYLVTRNLWAPIGIHWSWNLFEGPVFGTPVSGMEQRGLLESVTSGPELWTGGAFGPEGGLVALIGGTGSGIALCIVAIRRGNILRPGGHTQDPLMAAFEDPD